MLAYINILFHKLKEHLPSVDNHLFKAYQVVPLTFIFMRAATTTHIFIFTERKSHRAYNKMIYIIANKC